jgi:hypothetical protein
MLEARCGTLSADVLAALTAADEGTLDSIAKHAATGTLEDMIVRLGLC